MSARSVLVLVLLAAACSRPQQQAPPARAAAPATPVQQGKALLEQGQLDAALAKLQEAPADPESLFLQGAVWAKKAESAPLPTPPPPPSPMPKGAELPAAPEFKPEELTAIELFEKAVAVQPDQARAHLALAELLAPHAARWQDQQEAAAMKQAPRKGKAAPTPPPTLPTGPDYRPERVVQAYQIALQYDPASKAAAESFVKFCLRVHRLDDADAALRELVKRDKENPAPLIRYGDFLLNDKKDHDGAIEQYRQALIWRPDDDETRGKLADIYIARGMEHFGLKEYAIAEARFHEAEKYVTDKNSPRGLKIQDHLARLRSIRRPQEN